MLCIHLNHIKFIFNMIYFRRKYLVYKYNNMCLYIDDIMYDICRKYYTLKLLDFYSL